jgi:hypothetical protein
MRVQEHDAGGRWRQAPGLGVRRSPSRRSVRRKRTMGEVEKRRVVVEWMDRVYRRRRRRLGVERRRAGHFGPKPRSAGLPSLRLPRRIYPRGTYSMRQTSSSSSLNNHSLVACHSLSRICSVKPPPVCPPLGDVIRTANRPRQQPARCPDSRWSVEGIPLLAIVGTARVAQAERPARRAEAELAVLRLLALCAATREPLLSTTR